MIFTHIHQLFLHDHGSSVFAGNKATSFKSRSLGLDLGEDVRMGAVVHLRHINLEIWKQRWGQNLPLPSCLPCFKCERPALPEKLHCFDKWVFLWLRESGSFCATECLRCQHGHIVTTAQSKATGCLHGDYPTAVWQLPHLPTTPNLIWVHFVPSKLFFIHV